VSPAQTTPEFAAHRRRLFIMLGVVAICFMVAAGMVLTYVRTHEAWRLAVFAGAILAGFAAQGWMIVRFIQTGKPKP
jgi:3-hydroxymyristoyl/3-hydroxydecanoyl-(acyl carrier protein) dehydratase